MRGSTFPEADVLARRRAMEKTLRQLRPVLCGLMGVAMVLVGVLLLVRLPLTVLSWIPIFLGGVWAVGLALLGIRFLKTPDPRDVAKRGDRVMGLQDDLLALAEFPKEAAEWQQASWRKAQADVQAMARNWKLRLSRGTELAAVGALVSTVLVLWIAHQQWTQAEAIRAAAEAAKNERVLAAEEVLEDWDEFVAQEEDPELKKIFGETAALRQAFNQEDPMAAMLAMNQVEAKLNALQESLSSQSLAPQAAKIAEAMEAFSGMGAMSAALRNQNFEAAAKEAEKLTEQLKKSGETPLRRGEAVAEMLAGEAATAGKRGNSSLSQTLSELASGVAKNKNKNAVSNEDLQPGMKSLKNQLQTECMNQSRGRQLGIGKQQLEALRSAMRGEPCEGAPSLCNSGSGDKPGGNKAGTGTAGPPEGQATELAEAAVGDQIQGVKGEGESEVTVTSANSGTAAAASAEKATQLNEYLELSERAVADESIPLAHRRAIRNYFQRIRPVAEKP